jgi:predicted RNase H-like nuclease
MTRLNGATLIGIDGIRGGWIAATREDSGALAVTRIESLRDAMAWMAKQSTILVVDIPLGLLACTPRGADVEARAFLGVKHSSVFPSPYHGMLAAAEMPLTAARQEAARLRRELDGGASGCTLQTAAILPKIAEAERWVPAAASGTVFEGHPEVTFAILNGGLPVLSKKDRVAGRTDRLRLLAPCFGDLGPHLGTGRRLGAKPDDVLDAFAMLWTAERIARGDPGLRYFPHVPEPAVGGKTAQIVA